MLKDVEREIKKKK